MPIYKQLALNNLLAEPYAFPSELVMEAFIVDNPTVLSINDDDLSDPQVLEQQKPLAGAGSGKSIDGRIDLMVRYGSGRVAIVELKNGQLRRQHLDQLCAYLRAQSESEIGKELASEVFGGNSLEWFGILVGNSIDPTFSCELIQSKVCHCDGGGDFPVVVLLCNRFRDKNLTTVTTVDVLFDPFTSSRNKDRFEVESTVMAKNRFVLYVVKQYVAANPASTLPELQAAFPDWLQHPKKGTSTLGVVRDHGALPASLLPPPFTKYKRYFFDPSDVVHLACGTEVVVCNQWGIPNIRNVIDWLISPDFGALKGGFSMTFSFGGRTYTV